MNSNIAVSDSTDWLQTSLPLIASVETALRCQVCKDFYDTPIITSCSHTFCSLCIRKCLSSDGRCPACREQDQASKLRRNWAIQEVVDAFQAARSQALDVAQKRIENESWSKKKSVRKKRKWEDLEDLGEGPQKSPRRTRSQSRRAASGTSSQDVVILDSDEGQEIRDSGPELEPVDIDDGLVPCPVCETRMKEELVFSHLDRCDGKPAPRKAERMSALPQRPSSGEPTQAKSKISPISQLTYSLLKDGPLRKKLSDLGIPAWGARELLIRRHTEWVNLYNSNADSSRPRSNRELLRELDTWERSQGGKASGKEAATKKKDFDGKEWARGNKDQFADLIRQARAKRPTTANQMDRVEGASNLINGALPSTTGPVVQIQDQQEDAHRAVNAGAEDNIVLEPSSTFAVIEASSQNTKQFSPQDTSSPQARRTTVSTPETPGHTKPTSVREGSLPGHLSPPDAKKPMFAVPTEQIRDGDQIESTQ